MNKILTVSIGQLRGTVYQYKLGYGYKIVYNRKTIAQNYVYFKDKDLCIERMEADLRYHSEFNKNLFDLERI